MKKIGVIHGPNLDRLGLREPEIYGHATLDSINETLAARAKAPAIDLDFFQSNYEGALIEHIHKLSDQQSDALIINPAALTHSSIALRDALLASQLPFIDVHISNIFARETYRHHSYLSDIATGVICGLGSQGYLLALDAFIQHFSQ